jgi:type I restriction enzyme, S subunit
MIKKSIISDQFKDSPLGKIPINWYVQRIGNMTKTIAGGTPSTTVEEYWGGEIKWMSSGELNLKKVYDVEGRITELGLKNSSTKIIPIKCVLIGLAGQGKTRGTVAMNMIELCTNQSVAAIFPGKDFYEDYLFYNLDFRYEELRQLPPLPEQKAIAHVLGLMDSAINTNNQLIAKKELQKKWLMQNLLTGKRRLKGFEKEKWEDTSLLDLFERVTRKNIEQNTNVVTISAQRGFVRQTDFFNKSIASEIVDNYFLVEKGEFCYNKSYSNGYPWGATKRLKDFDKAVVTTLYICFAIKNSQKNSGDFFEHYFEANLLDKGLTKIAHEGGRAHGLLNVTPSDFFSLRITIPNHEEQNAIAQVIQAADKEIQLLKAKAEKLKEQKGGLMQVLLTGKKRLII